MKKLLFTAALLAIIISAQAQKRSYQKVNFSLGIDAGLPTGGLSDTHTFMYGASLQLGVPVVTKLHFTASLGYNAFTGKNNTDLQLQDAPLYNYPNIRSVPLKLGLKYYLEPNLYVQGEGGATFLPNGARLYNEATYAYLYAAQIGVELPAGKSNFVNVGLRYESAKQYSTDSDMGNISFIGLNMGIGF